MSAYKGIFAVVVSLLFVSLFTVKAFALRNPCLIQERALSRADSRVLRAEARLDQEKDRKFQMEYVWEIKISNNEVRLEEAEKRKEQCHDFENIFDSLFGARRSNPQAIIRCENQWDKLKYRYRGIRNGLREGRDRMVAYMETRIAQRAVELDDAKRIQLDMINNLNACLAEVDSADSAGGFTSAN